MSKATAPLLSFGASGQLGSTLVYAKWKGISYARRYTVPANPDSDAQRVTRTLFSWLQAVYKVAPVEVTAPWAAYVQGKPLTTRNAWTKFNLGPMREQTDLAAMVASPGALGGLPPTALVLDAEMDNIEVNFTVPTTLPQGWTINSAVAAMLPEQDPNMDTDYAMIAGTDTTDPYEVNLAGETGIEYRVFGWLVWNRPDGSLAYSPSLSGTQTPT